MRIYIPVTVADLQAAEISPRAAFTVTSQMREMAPEEDEEGLEYLAFLAAADAAIDEGEVTRIVLAADAAGIEAGTGVVEVPAVAWGAVVSIHIDDLRDGELLAAIRSAQLGEEAARDRVNDADLLWYDASEREDVVRLIAAV